MSQHDRLSFLCSVRLQPDPSVRRRGIGREYTPSTRQVRARRCRLTVRAAAAPAARRVMMRKLLFGGPLLAPLWAATLVSHSTSAPAARPAAARSGASAQAQRAGFSVERLARVDALLERYVEDNQIA